MLTFSVCLYYDPKVPYIDMYVMPINENIRRA